MNPSGDDVIARSSIDGVQYTVDPLVKQLELLEDLILPLRELL